VKHLLSRAWSYFKGSRYMKMKPFTVTAKMMPAQLLNGVVQRHGVTTG